MIHVLAVVYNAHQRVATKEFSGKYADTARTHGRKWARKEHPGCHVRFESVSDNVRFV